MKTINSELQAYITNPAKDTSLRAFRKDNTDTYHSIEVIGLSWDIQVDNDFGILTKDQITISVPNTKNTHQPKDQQGIWDSIDRLKEEIKLEIDYPSYTWPGLRFVPFFKWNIYSSNTGFSSSATSLSLLTDKDITGELTTNILYENKKPWELVEIIMWILGLPISINKFEDGITEDEIELKVRYASWYKADAFSELQEIVEMASAYLVWDSYLSTYVYTTRRYIDGLKSLVTLPYSFNDVYDPEGSSFGLAHILSLNKEFRTNNILNSILIDSPNYIIKTRETAYTFILELEAGETKEIDQRFWSWEFYTSCTYTVNSISTNEDGTWEIFSSYANINLSVFPNGVSWTIQNTYTSKVYLSVSLNSTSAKLPSNTSELFEDSTSIINYGRKSRTLHNKYIQTKQAATKVWNTLLSIHKDPELVLILSVIGNPAIDVLDPARIDLTTRGETYRGIIKRINYKYNLQDGFQQDIELTSF